MKIIKKISISFLYSMGYKGAQKPLSPKIFSLFKKKLKYHFTFLFKACNVQMNKRSNEQKIKWSKVFLTNTCLMRIFMKNMKKEKTFKDRVYFTWVDEQKEKFERRMIEYSLKSNKFSLKEIRPGRFFYKLMNLIIEYDDFADFIFFYDPNKKNLKKEQK